MQGHLRIVSGIAGDNTTITVRTDVWDVRWAMDDNATVAIMEKTKLQILHDGEAEDPIRTNSHFSAFGSLEVTMVDMVSLMTQPLVWLQLQLLSIHQDMLCQRLVRSRSAQSESQLWHILPAPGSAVCQCYC